MRAVIRCGVRCRLTINKTCVQRTVNRSNQQTISARSLSTLSSEPIGSTHQSKSPSSSSPEHPINTTIPNHTPQTNNQSSNLYEPRMNVTPDIQAKVGRDLHLQEHHPINLIKQRIFSFFQQKTQPGHQSKYQSLEDSNTVYQLFDRENPVVSIQSNFDSLLVPTNHPSRRRTDTYYYDSERCLRTHTSAHQTQFLRSGADAFLVCGDCYRRDEIDATHYPVFHQMEGVRVWPVDHPTVNTEDAVVQHLQATLDGLISHLFGENVNRRWLPDSFPFTSPSLQVEVEFNGKWLEILGCGVIRPEICKSYRVNGQPQNVHGWAFGLGIERLAMILFDIPDIRLFWSQDPRFLTQFKSNSQAIQAKEWQPIKFQPFSKFPPCYKDLSFWIESPKQLEGEQETVEYHANDFSSIIRELAGDLVESVVLVDEFTHPKTGRQSQAWRVNYRSMTQSLTNEEVNALHVNVRQQLQQRLPITLR